MERFIPGPDTERQYRDTLGAFATGITVVTVTGPDGPVGMTANSFASVSLNPPLVLWSPARASGRFEAMTGADRFAIHVLGAQDQELATRFACSGLDFTGLETETTEGAPPLLAQGWIARFLCRRVAHHDGGDHAIVVGLVEEAARRSGPPLVFASGNYGAFTPQQKRRADI
ncbi:flavin reductase (DIM6/NTAB) family NADH-FMN oxidoreductase RutF [Rhodovulum bhavnagarense]|uniref:Flavin reductase (DIM6/NTAB) family NADH-FMN oxidoreductase RutF n=1 Tax=Rhodovulum bhavnagarense TaxID=992286 RepID=A0A4R2RJE8_9RHOB|nr:flavin reductase family protein [Rhodovulum bhavnagarense]TCP63193.1 flavin reductase (DIM6/NTAB) family NADH-FMN oxidoreductase RutF [Rhodovulum bhavnagarense]